MPTIAFLQCEKCGKGLGGRDAVWPDIGPPTIRCPRCRAVNYTGGSEEWKDLGRGDKLLIVIKYLMVGAAMGVFPFLMAAMAAQFWFDQTIDDVNAWPWRTIFSIGIPAGCVLGMVMLGREIAASYARLRRKQRYGG